MEENVEKKETKETGGLSRREFLRDASLAVAGTAAGAAMAACNPAPAAPPAGQPVPTTAPTPAVSGAVTPPRESSSRHLNRKRR